MAATVVGLYHHSSPYSANAAGTIPSNSNTEKPSNMKTGIAEGSKHVGRSTRNSHTDSTGLVAMIVVLVLLVLGSATAYVLMRWHFAKQRGKILAAAATGKERGAEQGLKGPEVLTATREKDAQTHALGILPRNERAESYLERRRSFADGGGKV